VRQTSYVLTNGVWQAVEDLKLVSDPLLFGRHIAELNATNNALVRAYIWGLDLSETLGGAGGVGGLLWVRVATGPAAGTHFVCYDGNGNVWNLVSASTGTETARYEYGPFGESIRATGPLAKANRFRFSTKYQDDGGDVIYYGYRYYSARIGRWLTGDPLGDEGFFTHHVADKSRKEQRRLRRESLKPLYVFVQDDPVNYTDAVGLKIDAAWCQQWLKECTRENLLGLKSCLGCLGPSIGPGLATCAIGCLPFIKGGPVGCGMCLVGCSGIDSAVFMVGSSWCRDAFADGMKGCNEGYERCMDRVSE